VCRSDCREGGGDLASIHDQEENDFVAAFILDRPVRGGEKDTWIAGTITEAGGEFNWLDGSNWDYENWDLGEAFRKVKHIYILKLIRKGEPDRKSMGRQHHECVFMGKNTEDLGKWWDGVCKWTRWTFDCVCKK
jgi:hypothetical protein